MLPSVTLPSFLPSSPTSSNHHSFHVKTESSTPQRLLVHHPQPPRTPYLLRPPIRQQRTIFTMSDSNTRAAWIDHSWLQRFAALSPFEVKVRSPNFGKPPRRRNEILSFATIAVPSRYHFSPYITTARCRALPILVQDALTTLCPFSCISLKRDQPTTPDVIPRICLCVSSLCMGQSFHFMYIFCASLLHVSEHCW